MFSFNKNKDFLIGNHSIIIADSIYENISEDKIKKLYNAGFIGMNHNDSKSKKDALVERIKILSTYGIFDINEWYLSGAEYHKGRTSCICGQSNISNRYILTNRSNGSKVSIGASCLKEHFRLSLTAEAKEVMGFSKTHTNPYVWLGHKYDALIFASLGFKNATKYFQLRNTKKTVPEDFNIKIKDMLVKSLWIFKSEKWHKKLERARRLYVFIVNNRSGAKKDKDSGKDFSQIIAGEINERALALIILLNSARRFFEKNRSNENSNYVLNINLSNIKKIESLFLEYKTKELQQFRTTREIVGLIEMLDEAKVTLKSSENNQNCERIETICAFLLKAEKYTETFFKEYLSYENIRTIRSLGVEKSENSSKEIKISEEADNIEPLSTKNKKSKLITYSAKQIEIHNKNNQEWLAISEILDVSFAAPKTSLKNISLLLGELISSLKKEFKDDQEQKANEIYSIGNLLHSIRHFPGHYLLSSDFESDKKKILIFLEKIIIYKKKKYLKKYNVHLSNQRDSLLKENTAIPVVKKANIIQSTNPSKPKKAKPFNGIDISDYVSKNKGLKIVKKAESK
ncbi:MAG: hypothetical protein PHO62_07900 [Sulfurimonas sp.]|uniref:hypothetical protein n=1 Tax=Sulfurimonas sp. TaxID=2022749 RepID=UPI002615B42B|nr:hypothetical protein [Sulfurimonas sp.]MDD5373330.1 hypothetical protein [Sulfurimonas sp.]